MPLQSLPVEIFLMIVQMLEFPNLSALIRANKYLNDCFTNHLYRRSGTTDGWALHWAVFNNQVETARRFLKLAGSPHARYNNDNFMSYVSPSRFLVECVAMNSLEMTSLLLEYGANTEMQDCCRATALY